MNSLDNFKPRGHQARLAQAVERKIASGEKVHVANIFPGSGKTSGYLNALNILFRKGLIDYAVILTPRLNLAIQAEFDLAEMVSRSDFAKPHMGAIYHRENRPPLIGDRGQFGYATTYASLTAATDFHLAEMEGKRFALVCDEAHQLGIGDDGADEAIGTKSAHAVSRLAAMADKVFIMTGTPFRADGKPLVLASYTEPDANGRQFLFSDVDAGYREGVERGYLRPFDCTIVEGAGTFEFLDGEKERMVLAEMDRNIGKVLRHKDIWQDMVDKTINRVRMMQQVDARYSGLIAAVDQRHADQIMSYLKSEHGTVRAVIATSDKPAAHDNLRAFRQGAYDILITVAMAHVGYDHQPITVVCMLNHYREWGWVLQLLARGLRVMTDKKWPNPPALESQVLHAIIPDDKRAIEIAEWMRDESEMGMDARQSRDGKERAASDPFQERIGMMTDAEVLGYRGISYDPDGDIASDEWIYIDSLVDQFPEFGAVGRGPFKKLLDGIGATIPRQAPATIERNDDPRLTQKEKENLRRSQISKVVRGFDIRLMRANVLDSRHGTTAAAMIRKFGTGMTDRQMPEHELDRRETWLKGEWAEYVNRVTSKG